MGACVLEVEEPDVVIYRLRAVVDAPQIRTMRAAEGAWNKGKPYLLALIDLSQQEHATLEARKAALEPTPGTKQRAIAIFGGSSHSRVLADLVFRARAVLLSTAMQTRFFPDEASARVWLYAQRERLAASV